MTIEELYPVEPGFEMPTGGGNKVDLESLVYPFSKMKNIGDAFPIILSPDQMVVPKDKKSSFAERVAARCRGKSYTYAKHFQKGFKVSIHERNMNEHYECGLRVWRVK